MLADDDVVSAAAAASIFDSRVAQFLDGARLLGSALGRSLGESSTAWDIYVAYGRGVRWDSRPPSPASYVHQLGNWADASRYRTGEALALEIGGIAAGVLG